ncbi:MAG: sensor histidine kinase, partial [Nocardioidaceae bacterium]
MHAGALAYRTDLTEQEAGQSARIIQQNAHQALVDLRQVLGVLREDREDSDVAHSTDRPQPTYGDIAGLVEEAVAAGTAVKYDAAVAQAAEMPEQVGRTVYRIVQEALTNVRKHAPGVTVSVRLTGSPGEGVDVVVRNPTRLGQVSLTPGAGLGLVGLTERTELTGGRLVHTVDRESFTLHGWLPWRQ